MVGRIKAQAGQDPVGVGLHGVAAELLEPGLGLAELNQQTVLLVARRLADPGAQGLDASGQLSDRPGAQHGLFEHRPTDFVRELLREVADTEVPGSVDLAGVGFLQADDGFDEGGFAGSVAAH